MTPAQQKEATDLLQLAAEALAVPHQKSALGLLIEDFLEIVAPTPPTPEDIFA